MATVTLSQVRKSYGTVETIHGIDIDIQDGEFLVLVGPSGCGKSTLLRMVAGLETVTSGSIRIGDRVVNDLDPKDRDIAMVFQNYALYPHMTVAQNMGFSLEHRGETRARIAERVQWAAGILGLDSLLTRYPKELSGGQRQRVAMGRAIVRDPQVFLFDEPLSNLDAKLRTLMRAEIKALHHRLQTTTIYVTHDQTEAMGLADRIVVLQAGQVEQIGTPLELFDRPTNRFVAGFIGSPAMNFLTGWVQGGRFTLSGTDVALPVPSGIDAEAVLGLRPEHLQIAADGLPAVVEVVEPMGSDTLVSLRLGGQPLTALFHQRVTARPSEILHLRPTDGAAHLFDATSGFRLN